MCGITHGGVRWKRCSRPTRGWISGTTCTAVAPTPISATRLPVRSSRVVPVGRVEGIPLEALEAGQGRGRGLAEQAGRGHEHARGERAGGGLELPALRVRDPGGGEQLAAQPRVRQHAEAPCAVAQVLEDLVAHRVGAVPVGLRAKENE